MYCRSIHPSQCCARAGKCTVGPSIHSHQLDSASVQMQHPAQPYPSLTRCLIGYARWEVFSRRRRPHQQVRARRHARWEVSYRRRPFTRNPRVRVATPPSASASQYRHNAPWAARGAWCFQLQRQSSECPGATFDPSENISLVAVIAPI